MDFSQLYHLTSSQGVHIGRCLLLGVVISGDGANADCDVYDNAASGGTKKLHLETLSGTSVPWRSRAGVEMKNGVYVVVNASTTNVSVELMPLSDKGG